jgi:hypothetical protein
MDIYQVHAGTHLGIVGGFGEKLVAIDKKKNAKNAIINLVRRDFRIAKNVRPKNIDDDRFTLGKIECRFSKFNICDLVDEVLN